MKVWTNNEFTGFYPVGSAAVVIADDAESAADMLNLRLRGVGLDGDAEASGMCEIALINGNCAILSDGNY